MKLLSYDAGNHNSGRITQTGWFDFHSANRAYLFRRFSKTNTKRRSNPAFWTGRTRPMCFLKRFIYFFIFLNVLFCIVFINENAQFHSLFLEILKLSPSWWSERIIFLGRGCIFRCWVIIIIGQLKNSEAEGEGGSDGFGSLIYTIFYFIPFVLLWFYFYFLSLKNRIWKEDNQHRAHSQNWRL